MKNRTIVLLVLIIAGTQCTSKKNENPENTSISEEQTLSSVLLGEWRNLSMEVNIKSFNQGTGDTIVVVAEGDWENTLKIQPIRTTFQDNGVYRSAYWSLADTLLMEKVGKWSVSGGDSLEMIEDGVSTMYFTEIDGDRVIFSATLDWDGDGELDDHYSGTQQKQ